MRKGWRAEERAKMGVERDTKCQVMQRFEERGRTDRHKRKEEGKESGMTANSRGDLQKAKTGLSSRDGRDELSKVAPSRQHKPAGTSRNQRDRAL